MLKMVGLAGKSGLMLVGGLILLISAASSGAEIDKTRYLSPDDLKAGMKGFGKTVMSGTEIETFEFEVISVMRNAWYAKQDVILVRCSGLNLEHSGIVGGMSGSPCYVWDSDGKVKMIGAVAYGWAFNKDPVCGVQPITQMIDISEFRMPKAGADVSDKKEKSVAGSPAARAISGKGVALGEVIARHWFEPVRPASRFCIFNDEIASIGRRVDKTHASTNQLQSLKIPVMISGGSSRAMSYLYDRLERFGMVPVISGAPATGSPSAAADITIEPGSVLCVTFMTGDLVAQGLGTCTEVIGDRVLAFGHSMDGRGSVELPLSTGMVHTVIPSVMRSTKIGSAVKVAGTLWGDETTGIFGILGRSPRMIDLEVKVDDVRGERTYNYQVAHDKEISPYFMAVGVLQSVLSHSDLPEEHTVDYKIETEFEGLGKFSTSNTTSQDSIYGLEMDMVMPIMSMMNAPFGKARVSKLRAEVTVKEGARLARIDQATLAKTVYKPGETVDVRVRWFHFHAEPSYSYETYSMALPGDLPDGKYRLGVGSLVSHLNALKKEKPHIFRVESLSQMLEALNYVCSFSENRLFMRLISPVSGLAVKQIEMPELPSFKEKILTESNRSDINKYIDAKVVEYKTDFMVSGDRSFEITVDRRADQR